MSKVVDQRVVEMRFDNQHFEKNVNTTMSTLDKLKQKLNFKGITKGLDDLNSATKKVDMNGLGRSVESVGLKFNAMYTMADQALRNITTRVQQTGERMIKALTIDPIKTGLQEYETQINSVQTILANTESKGTDINQVNAALEELNKYADMTIYNFTEMTRNIGTFTAAGVDLDTSVSAIKGIANLAAVSGSTSQQASTAMYQLSQALATGKVKLQDWNSVVNAGMGGEVFQNALKRTATVMGTNVDALIEKYGSFRDSLTQGEWLTTDVLTETLNQFTMAAKEGSDEWNNFKKSLEEKGYTEEQALAILKMANTATDAATKVKTFTQLWDVLKESAQSGWSQTWKLIIGDFEEAKALLTPISDFLTGAINKFSDARNSLLEGALGKSFKHISKAIQSVTDPVKKSADSIKNVVDSVADYTKVVDEIIGGKWGDGEKRWHSLTQAGYDWAHAQNLVNEKLGEATRHTTKYNEAQKETSKTQEEIVETQKEMTDGQIKLISNLTKMSEETLKSKGYTQEQIKAFKELGDMAEKTGLPLEEFIKNIDQIDGRWLLINSFKNAAQGLVAVFRSIGEAWKNAFPPMQSDQLFNIIAGFHKFSMNLRVSDETAEKLTRTFKGLFAIVDMITTVVGGGFKIAFKLLSQVLSYFDMDILDVTAAIGDAIVGFRDWFDSIFDVSKALDVIVPAIKSCAGHVKQWISAFTNLPMVSKLINAVKASFEFLKNYDYSSIGSDLIAGFENGLLNGMKNAFSTIVEFGKELLSVFCAEIGVESPSWKMFEIAMDFLQGFFNGLKEMAGTVWGYLTEFGSKCLDIIKGIDPGAVFAIAISGGMLYFVKKISDALEILSGPIGGISDVLGSASGMMDAFGDSVKKVAKAKAMKEIATAIGILAVSILILALIPTEKLWGAVGAVIILAGVMIGLSVAMDKLGSASVSLKKGEGFNAEGLRTSLLMIGVALLMIAATVKLLGGMSPSEMEQGFLGLVGVVLAIAAVLFAYDKLVKETPGKNIEEVGALVQTISWSLLLMAVAVRIVSKLSPDEIKTGTAFIIGFGILVGVLIKIGTIGNDQQIAKVGGLLLAMTISMILMVGVCKLVRTLSIGDVLAGAAFVTGFMFMVKTLVKVTTIGKEQQIAKVAGLIMSMSFALILMIGVCKLVNILSVEDVFKGALFIGAFILIIKALVSVLTVGKDQEIAKVGGTLLMFSLAIGIMAGAVALLSLMNLAGLAKGLIAVGLLSEMMAGMIRATNGATDMKGSLIVMVVAIGVLALAVAGLSLIDTGKLAGATAAMSMLMFAFSIIIKSTSSMGTGILGSLIVVTVAVGLLAGILWLLSTLNVQSSVQNAAALSILLVAVSGALFILSKISVTAGQAFTGILLMAAMIIPMAAFIGALALMNKVQNASSNALILIGLMTTMTVLLAVLTVIGNFGPLALAGVISLTLMFVPMFAFLVLVNQMNNIQNAAENIKLLVGLMTTMTAILTVLAIIGPLALIGVAAMQGLVLVMAEIVIFAGILGGLVNHYDGLQKALDTGLPLLEKIAGSIGTMLGNFVSGFLTSVTSSLPQIGMDLSMFMTNLTPFIVGAKMIDETVITGIKALSGAIIALSAAELLAGIASFVNEGASFAQMGMDLSMFMVNAMPFIMGIRLIDPTIAEGAKSLAETILILTGANLIEGIASWLTGKSSLSEFGAQLGDLGTNLNAFAINLGSFDEAKLATVTCAANAVKAIAQAASEIPNEGGWAAKIFGENSIATFSSYLPDLGTNMSAFAQNLGTFTDDQVKTVECAANAIKAMAEVAKDLPNDGGWAGKIFGENSLSTFGGYLPDLGTNLASFVTNLGTFSEDQVTTVDCASRAIKAMADVSSGIDGQAEWAKKIFGENGLGAISNELGDLGTNLASFVTNLGTFTEAQVTTVDCAVRAIRALASLAGVDLASAKSSIGGFGDKLSDLGADIKAMCESLPSEETIGIAETNIKKVLTLIKEVSNTDTTGAAEFTNSLQTLGKDGVSKFVGAFTSSETTTSVKSAGEKLMEYLTEAIEGEKATLEKVCDTMVDTCIKTLKDGYEDFKTAGKYLVEGFAAGIKNNAYLAGIAAEAMVNAAEAAAREAAKIESPSKLFMGLGKYIPQGFAIGIDKMAGVVKDSTAGMTDTAVDGVKGAISKVADAVNTDIDTQPTIRPVLDLSDIKSGAGAIDNMLGGVNPSIRTLATVGSISSMMNGNQNGGSSDVVSAINKLRDDLSNIGGNTYNSINGITYDDGSNVANAIQTLVRATKIERRV